MVFIPRWDRYRDKKPLGAVEIDWSHELTNGLKNLIIPSGDSIATDIVDNNTSTAVGLKFDGDHAKSTAATGRVDFSGDILLDRDVTTDFSVTIICDIPDPSKNNVLVCQYPNEINGTRGVFAVYSSKFAFFDGAWSYLSGSITEASGAVTLVRKAQVYYCYYNGVLLGNSVTRVINLSEYKTDIIGNASYGDSTSNSFSSVLKHTYALSEAEIKSLHEAPYQILKPRRRWFVFGGVSANIFNQSISLATTNSIIDSVNTDYNQSSILSSAYNIQTDKVVSANLNISLDSLQQLSNDSNALLNGTLTLTTKSGVSTSTLTSTTIDVFIDIANSYGVTPSVSVDYNPVINLNVANTTITDSIASLNLDISLNSLLNYLNEPSSQLEGTLTLTSSSGITTSNTTLTTIDAFITLANSYGVVPSITIDYSTDINFSVLNSITNNTLLNYNVLTNLDLLTRLNTTYGAVSLPIEVLINLNSAYNIIKNVLVEYDGNINIDYKSSLNNNTNTDYSSNISLDLNNDISNIVNSDYNLNSQLDLHTNIVSNLSSVLDVSMLLNYSNSISDTASLSYDFNISLGINELISTLQQLEINPEVILNASFQNNNDTITNYNPSIELTNNNSIVNNSITDYNTSVSLAVQNILSSTSGKDLVANISLIAQQGISTTQLITLEGSIDLGIINTYSNETLTTIDVNVDLTSAFLESLGTSVISQLDVSLDASYEVLTNGRNPNLVIRTNKGQEILVKAVNKDLKIQYIDRNIYI